MQQRREKRERGQEREREREGEGSAEIVGVFSKLKTLKRALSSKDRNREGERR